MISILKITKGNNSVKRYKFSILTIYKIKKWHKTEKNVEGITVQNQSMVCTKVREIISNRNKVIEWTQYLCLKLKRVIIQKIK